MEKRFRLTFRQLVCLNILTALIIASMWILGLEGKMLFLCIYMPAAVAIIPDNISFARRLVSGTVGTVLGTLIALGILEFSRSIAVSHPQWAILIPSLQPSAMFTGMLACAFTIGIQHFR